jgi:hypothetical protein
MGFRNLINKFTAGELDPKFLGEVDYEGYRKGARKLRNVICTPQGAAQKRFGTIYEATISIGGTFITNEDQVRIIPFEYLSSEVYWFILKSNGVGGCALDVYLDVNDDATFQQTINPFSTFTTAQIPDIRWVEDVNKLVFLHEAHIPVIVQRVAANNWTVNNVVFSFYPGEDYSSFDSPTNNYTNNGTTFTPNAVDATTITASTAVFTSNHSGIAPNGGGFFVGNGGIFRIMTVNAAGTVATGYSTEEFADTTAIPGSEAFLAERAWGDGSVIGGAPAGANRGYPRHGAFFQSRLVLGGSPASPGTAYASEVKDYFSFDNSNTDPSTGWGVEAGVTGTDLIDDIVSTKSLVLLTNKGSSATSILVDTATTPTNVFLNTQGQEACRNMDAVILNNQVIYADFGGNTIWTMVYDIPDSGYSVFNASIISAHLIRNPQWAAVYDPAAIDGRYYLLINEDGTLAIYNSILEENIKSWTLAQTIGSFVDVGCVANAGMVLAKRQINTGATTTGLAQAVYTVDDEFYVFRNVTATIDAGTGTEVMLADDNYLLIGNEIPFTRLAFVFGTPASADADLVFEFLTNTGEWEEFTPDTDTTLGFSQNGSITWTYAALSNWKAQTISSVDTVNGDGLVYYWIRIMRDNAAAITPPTINTMFINTAYRIHMERLSFDAVMDCTVTTTSNNLGIVSGLTYLAGQNVYVFANEFPLQTYYVSSTGTIEVDFQGALITDADIVLGLDTPPVIVPMPVVSLTQDGYSVYEPKKIKAIYIDFYETLGLTAQGQNIPQVIPGNFMTDRVPVPVSSYEKVPWYAGWDPRVDVVLSQSYPAKMTIRGISYEVELT